MLPARGPPVDVSKLSPQEQLLFKKYGGKMPTHKNVLMKMQKDRKYFDSGDYALSKAGVAPQTTVGTAIPSPENIPHASSPTNGKPAEGTAGSPTNTTNPINRVESALAHEAPKDGEEVQANAENAEGEAKTEEADKQENPEEAPLVAPQPTAA